MMKSVKLLDPRWRCLVTWADTTQGHTGGIYRAAGWEYLGLSKPTDIWEIEGRRVGRQRSSGDDQSRAAMAARGAVFVGMYPKHRFRLVRTRLPLPKQKMLPLMEAM